MSASFHCLEKLCENFGAMILKSVDVDAEMLNVPEGVVNRSAVKTLMEAGANIIWFHQDYPDFAQTKTNVCRIEVEISQLKVEHSRARIVSADDIMEVGITTTGIAKRPV